jgi:hypothetical protein
MTPLMAADYIKPNKIDILEADIRKRLYNIPRDVPHTTINNLLQIHRLSSSQ